MFIGTQVQTQMKTVAKAISEGKIAENAKSDDSTTSTKTYILIGAIILIVVSGGFLILKHKK